MELKNATNRVLLQLQDVIHQMSDNEFVQEVDVFNGATIGQHIRHTLEFFICLKKSDGLGLVNYDKRDHDKDIESNRQLSLIEIDKINSYVQGLDADQKLRLEVNYDLEKEQSYCIDTNVYRELAYNIEHAIHHMAIMKIGLKQLFPHIGLPADFGIASSTVRHAKSISA